MDTFDQRIAHCLGIKAITYIIIGILLVLFELMLVGQNVALQQAPFLLVNATCFFALNLVSGIAYKWVMKDNGKRAIGFYLAVKVVRFFLVIAILLIYALADCRNILAFAINLIVLYIANVVTSIIFYIKMEQNFKTKQ